MKPDKIKPQIIKNVANEITDAPVGTEFRGEYTLVSVKNGIEGEPFTANASTYNKVYRGNPNFVVKKKSAKVTKQQPIKRIYEINANTSIRFTQTSGPGGCRSCGR